MKLSLAIAALGLFLGGCKSTSSDNNHLKGQNKKIEPLPTVSSYLDGYSYPKDYKCDNTKEWKESFKEALFLPQTANLSLEVFNQKIGRIQALHKNFVEFSNDVLCYFREHHRIHIALSQNLPEGSHARVFYDYATSEVKLASDTASRLIEKMIEHLEPGKGITKHLLAYRDVYLKSKQFVDNAPQEYKVSAGKEFEQELSDARRRYVASVVSLEDLAFEKFLKRGKPIRSFENFYTFDIKWRDRDVSDPLEFFWFDQKWEDVTIQRSQTPSLVFDSDSRDELPWNGIFGVPVYFGPDLTAEKKYKRSWQWGWYFSTTKSYGHIVWILNGKETNRKPLLHRQRYAFHWQRLTPKYDAETHTITTYYNPDHVIESLDYLPIPVSGGIKYRKTKQYEVFRLIVKEYNKYLESP